MAYYTVAKNKIDFKELFFKEFIVLISVYNDCIRRNVFITWI